MLTEYLTNSKLEITNKHIYFFDSMPQKSCRHAQMCFIIEIGQVQPLLAWQMMIYDAPKKMERNGNGVKQFTDMWRVSGQLSSHRNICFIVFLYRGAVPIQRPKRTGKFVIRFDSVRQNHESVRFDSTSYKCRSDSVRVAFPEIEFDSVRFDSIRFNSGFYLRIFLAEV